MLLSLHQQLYFQLFLYMFFGLFSHGSATGAGKWADIIAVLLPKSQSVRCLWANYGIIRRPAGDGPARDIYRPIENCPSDAQDPDLQGDLSQQQPSLRAVCPRDLSERYVRFYRGGGVCIRRAWADCGQPRRRKAEK